MESRGESLRMIVSASLDCLITAAATGALWARSQRQRVPYSTSLQRRSASATLHYEPILQQKDMLVAGASTLHRPWRRRISACYVVSPRASAHQHYVSRAIETNSRPYSERARSSRDGDR